MLWSSVWCRLVGFMRGARRPSCIAPSVKRRGMQRWTERERQPGRARSARLQRETQSRERMCLAPQSVCHPEWLNADLCPPCCFVATSMNFAVMSAAQWDRELITHLSSKCSALCKSEVVRIGRTPTANQTGMSCDEFHMLAIADSTRLRMGRTAFFDPLDSGSFGRLRSFPLKRRCGLAHRSKGRWPWLCIVEPQVLALPTSPGTHSPTAAHLRRSTSS